MRAKDLDFNSLVDFHPERGVIEFCGHRAILVQTDTMGALHKELVESLGKEIAKVILTRYGFSCGLNDARRLAADMQFDNPLNPWESPAGSRPIQYLLPVAWTYRFR